MSRFKTCGLCFVLCALGAVTLAQEQPYVMVLPGDVEWGPATPKLPPGAEIAVLIGDPSKAGIPYVFRARLPDGYSVPPHWHPMDENVTVIEGVMMLGFGERVDRAAMRELPVGSYVTLPKEMPHYNRMKGETILQFHGIGPYDITYVNPADDPSRISSGFGPPEAGARASEGSGELALVVEPAATESRTRAPAATGQEDLPQVSEESAAERQRQIAEAEKKVAQAQRRVSGLEEEQHRYATNPFRPTPDELNIKLHRAGEELRKANKELEQLRDYPH